MILQILNWFFRPWVWFCYKTNRTFQCFKSGLLFDPKAKVLEIGSGSNPWFRATILSELYIEESVERGNVKLVVDKRPMVQCDAELLPFEDKAIDFIVATQVAEHIYNIGKFFDEVQRVGKAGYIETPNYLFEQTVGTTTHCWALWTEGDVIHAEKKWISGCPIKAYNGMHKVLGDNPFVLMGYMLVPELQVMRFSWKGSFKYVLHKAPSPIGPTKAEC